MPEGPEIRRAAQQLHRVLAGKVTTQVGFAADKFPHLQTVSPKLARRVIERVEARGKAILTHFAGGLSVYSHNQLYGEWRIFKGEAPPSHLQTRLVIATATHTAVLYSASEIEVLISRDIYKHRYIARLGIELLDRAVTEAAVHAHLTQPRFARRSLGALLLDQGFLAGIGNYLRSEILFKSGLRPEARLAALAPEQTRALARHALEVTRQSWRTRGITNDPARAARLKAAGWPFARYRHLVFDRTDEACHVCGSQIGRSLANGRSVFLCPGCQPAGD